MRLPPDISSEGWRIDRLLHLTTVMVTVLAVAFILWLIVALWRGARTKTAAPLPSAARQALLPLAVAALVLVVLDGSLFVISTRDLHGTFLDTDGALEREGAVRVEISAQQWAWNVRYAGPDGRFATPDDPVTINELVVPIGAPVVIELGSSDVVHSLHLPHVRIKRDAIPGRISRLWFEATELGRYDMLCAQFCGTSHYNMLGVLRVVSREEFDRWIASAAADSLAIADEDIRSRADEPSRRPFAGTWPTFESEPAGRDWGWTWGAGAH